jgi:hypothetical protein
LRLKPSFNAGGNQASVGGRSSSPRRLGDCVTLDHQPGVRHKTLDDLAAHANTVTNASVISRANPAFATEALAFERIGGELHPLS